MIMKDKKKSIERFKIAEINLDTSIAVMTVMKKTQDQVFTQQEEAPDYSVENLFCKIY